MTAWLAVCLLAAAVGAQEPVAPEIRVRPLFLCGRGVHLRGQPGRFLVSLSNPAVTEAERQWAGALGQQRMAAAASGGSVVPTPFEPDPLLSIRLPTAGLTWIEALWVSVHPCVQGSPAAEPVLTRQLVGSDFPEGGGPRLTVPDLLEGGRQAVARFEPEWLGSLPDGEYELRAWIDTSAVTESGVWVGVVAAPPVRLLLRDPQSDQESGRLWRALAGERLREGATAEALAAAEQSLALDPQDGLAMQLLAASHDAAGHTDQALAWYQACLSTPRLDTGTRESVSRRLRELQLGLGN